MKKRQSDKNITKQVRIDAGWHKLLFQLRADMEVPIKSLIEDALSDVYAVNKDGKPYKIK